MTALSASQQYRQPLAVIRTAYAWGSKEAGIPPLGRRDAWGVWFASPRDLQKVFAPARNSVLATASVERTATKLSAIRAMQQARAHG